MMTSNIENSKHSNGRLLIVDDDPIVSGMLGASLKKTGFEVVELASGEECLERIADISPDAIFLDIEMQGIDGYETCRRLRANKATNGLFIIFLSAKDDLDSRLAAFDVGADDFIAKPFVAEEVNRKANVAIRLKQERSKLLAEKVSAEQDASVALSNLDEAYIVIKFIRRSLGCRSLETLAALIVKVLTECGLKSNVQIRSHFGTITLTPDGVASPLESSVIELSKDQGRIFQFKRRMIVNYDQISILVLDMPIEDEMALGRIRDYVSVICESSESTVENITLRLNANARAEELRQLVEATRVALAKFHKLHRGLQNDSRIALDQMIQTIESMYISLGLLDSQEYSISEVVRSATTKIMDLLEQGSSADGDFIEIVENLAEVSKYQVEAEEETEEVSIQLF